MTYDTINDVVTRAGGVGALLTGRYRIVRQLGQGGMGSVWLAEDTQLDNKPFAIKMLPSILVSNKRAYRQLKDEALVAMQLVHPNIVQIRAFEENNGNPFLVMDYIDGQTLDDYLAEHGEYFTQRRREAESQSGRARSPSAPQGGGFGRVEHVERVDGDGRGISESDVLRILRPIAAALDYAHAKGVVHRDVKPGNVMIAKDGTPYILDFGIAREIQETMTRVTGKLSSGTLLYMSPEQLTGEQPRPAQDVYSFAAMVYECLKGEPPFSHGQIEFQIINKQPEPLTGKAAILAAGVMSGLAKKPEDRPATCAAVLEGSGFSHNERKERKDVVANGNGRVEHVERVNGVGGAQLPSGPKPGVARFRATVVAVAIFIVALFAIAGGMWYYQRWKMTAIMGVNCELSVTYSPKLEDPIEEESKIAKIKRIFGLTNGVNLATIPYAELRTQTLIRFPEIKEIVIERQLPHSVNISVKGRVPGVRVATLNDEKITSGLVADYDGVVFRASNCSSLPIIREEDYKHCYSGRRLEGNARAALQLVHILADVANGNGASEPELKDLRVLEIDTSKKGYLLVTFADSSTAEIAWADMGENSDVSRLSLQRQLTHLAQAVAMRLTPRATRWVATEYQKGGRVYATDLGASNKKRGDINRGDLKKGKKLQKVQSDIDLKKMLEQGYRGASKNIATSEAQRCVSLISAAIKQEWDKENFTWNIGLRPIEVELKLGTGGVVCSFAIKSGSGDASVDSTALSALKRLKETGGISGLSDSFIEQFPTLTITMEPTAP